MDQKQKSEAASKPSRQPPYSARSQRSIVEQWRLENEISCLRQQIGYAERRLEKAEKNRVRQLSLVSGGQFIFQRNLDESLSEIDNENRNIASFRQHITVIESKIAALQPSLADAAERERVQGLLERAGRERLEMDQAADEKLKALLSILKARAALSLRMRELADQVDLPRNLNLDVERLASLYQLLPNDLAVESSRWLVWFLGSEPDRQAYQIAKERFTLPETLRHSHAYRRGESAILSGREKAEASKPEPLTQEQEAAVALRNHAGAPPQPPFASAKGIPGAGMIRL